MVRWAWKKSLFFYTASCYCIYHAHHSFVRININKNTGKPQIWTIKIKKKTLKSNKRQKGYVLSYKISFLYPNYIIYIVQICIDTQPKKSFKKRKIGPYGMLIFYWYNYSYIQGSFCSSVLWTYTEPPSYQRLYAKTTPNLRCLQSLLLKKNIQIID